MLGWFVRENTVQDFPQTRAVTPLLRRFPRHGYDSVLSPFEIHWPGEAR